MKKVIIPVIVAIVFWFVMFSPWTKEYVNFWITMGFAGATLTLMSALLGDNFKKQFSFSVKDILSLQIFHQFIQMCLINMRDSQKFLLMVLV